MATENPLWGEERIANELLLKLAIRVSPRTVRKYMPKRPQFIDLQQVPKIEDRDLVRDRLPMRFGFDLRPNL